MQVLVVEDEKRLAALLRQGLAEEDHSVVVAHDGREGLETALAGRFDAIILDVMLPVMDGLAVARRLREACNQTPILMLTARDSTVVGGRHVVRAPCAYLRLSASHFSLELLNA
jgi:DNA-binding response OmpR family regulator